MNMNRTKVVLAWAGLGLVATVSGSLLVMNLCDQRPPTQLPKAVPPVEFPAPRLDAARVDWVRGWPILPTPDPGPLFVDGGDPSLPPTLPDDMEAARTRALERVATPDELPDLLDRRVQAHTAVSFVVDLIASRTLRQPIIQGIVEVMADHEREVLGDARYNQMRDLVYQFDTVEPVSSGVLPLVDLAAMGGIRTAD